MMYVPNETILIHLTHKNGIYTLVSFNENEFKCKTKHTESTTLPFYYFKRLHGRTFNTATVQVFLDHMYKKRKSLKMWAQYQDHLRLKSFEKMTERELDLYFSKPYTTI